MCVCVCVSAGVCVFVKLYITRVIRPCHPSHSIPHALTFCVVCVCVCECVPHVDQLALNLPCLINVSWCKVSLIRYGFNLYIGSGPKQAAPKSTPSERTNYICGGCTYICFRIAMYGVLGKWGVNPRNGILE